MINWIVNKISRVETPKAKKVSTFGKVNNRDLYAVLRFAEENGLTPVNTYLPSGADSTVFLDEQGDIVKIYHTNLSYEDILKYYEIQKTVHENVDLLPQTYSEHGWDDNEYAIQADQIEVVYPRREDIEEITINGKKHVKVMLPCVVGEPVYLNDEEYKAVRKIYSEVFRKFYPEVGDNPFFKGRRSHKEMPLIRYPNIQKMGNKYYITDVDYIERLLKYFR